MGVLMELLSRRSLIASARVRCEFMLKISFVCNSKVGDLLCIQNRAELLGKLPYPVIAPLEMKLIASLLFFTHICVGLSNIQPRFGIMHHTNSESTPIHDAIAKINLKCILCDMDGTLLTDDHKPNLKSIESIVKVNKAGLPVIPATGRSRKSVNAATDNIFARLFQDEVPGIYSQGLQVYGLDGSLIFERFLGHEAIVAALEFCRPDQVTVVAYAGDNCYCQKTTVHTDMFPEYDEPIPTVFEDGLDKLELLAGVKVNKLVVMGDESDIVRIRPALTKALTGLASITQAMPNMLELLPLGASKGDGVKRFLEYEGIDPSAVVAFGDGENDIEMLKLVGLGVAMGNAKTIVKNVADIATLSNNDGGVGYVLDVLLTDLSKRQK